MVLLSANSYRKSSWRHRHLKYITDCDQTTERQYNVTEKELQYFDMCGCLFKAKATSLLHEKMEERLLSHPHLIITGEWGRKLPQE